MTGRRTLNTGASILAALGSVVSAAFWAGGASGAAPAGAAQARTAASATTSTTGPSFTKSEILQRTDLVDGLSQVVDQRDFNVSVSQTGNLRDRQEVTVAWTGAHPTGGTISDENQALAAQQEYPVVLMECRGVDSSSAPVSEQLSPESCWTQTPDERVQTSGFAFPPWRLDQYATPEDRADLVGTPSPYPDACQDASEGNVQYWVPFVGADGTVYPEGPKGCDGISPDQVTVQNPSLQPSNTTYAQSDVSGEGTDNFVISTATTNASLGCSTTVLCSLVIVPIMGISCDPRGEALPAADQSTDVPKSATLQATAAADCESTGNYAPGAPSSNGNNLEQITDSGLLWWSASNWRGRISVPLTFAPASNVCNIENTSKPVDVYGSELMLQATTQWEPAFCLNPKLFNFDHVQTGEPEAKNLLESGSIEAAIEGEPPGTPPTTPTVQAPIGVTGFAIAYVIDTSQGTQYGSLKLDPRLLAKLMTESYPGDPTIAAGEAALIHNPYTLYEDPEFQALNPMSPGSQVFADAAATLFSIDAQSDVVHALTSYVNSDPAARAWLDGAPDPWGMVVNPAYKDIALPVESWPLKDSVTTGPAYSGTSANQCLENSPAPIRPLVDAPQPNFADVVLNLQFGIAPSTLACTVNGGNIFQLAEYGAETVGDRFLLGVVPLAAADEYGLDTAALQTSVSPTATAKFTSIQGRTFVAPTDASLKAAAALLSPDSAAGSWTLPYGDFQTDPAAVSAYPGTMLMSLDVPTRGVIQPDAKDLAQLMTFAAGSGQTPGYGNGQLPPGYLPMTSSNGLRDQVVYTQAAAADVAAQNGEVPPLVAMAEPAPPETTESTTTTSSGSTTRAQPSTSASVPAVAAAPSATGPVSAPVDRASGSAHASSSNSDSASPSRPGATFEPAASFGPVPWSMAGMGGLAFPIALLVVVVGLVGMALSYARRRWRVR